jgi:hypothetical protein
MSELVLIGQPNGRLEYNRKPEAILVSSGPVAIEMVVKTDRGSVALASVSIGVPGRPGTPGASTLQWTTRDW